MISRLKQTLNKKGLTMMELIVGILVLTIIMTAVTSIFAPMLRAYQRANNLAEANTILDNLANEIMYHITQADEIYPPVRDIGCDDIPPMMTISLGGGRDIIFDIDDYENLLFIEDVLSPYPRRLLFEPEFYRGTTIDFGWAVNRGYVEEEWVDIYGLVTITLMIDSPDGWYRYRRYTIRPFMLIPDATP